jgi:hypothetical protein
MADGEVVEFAGGGIGFRIDVADVAVHFLAETFQDVVHFPIIAFKHQFNPAIGKIPDIALDSIAHRDVLRGVSEADTLNPPIEVDDATMHSVNSPLALDRRPIYRIIIVSPS